MRISALQLLGILGVIAVVCTTAAADAPTSADVPNPSPARSHSRESDPALAAGWRAYKRGNIAEAITAYEQALAASPGDASLWYDTGCLHALNHDAAKASAALRQALSLNPRLSEAYDALGQLSEQAGDVDRAHALYATANAIKPGSIKVLRHLSRVLMRLGQTEPARQVLYEFVGLAPNDVDARYQLGVLELRANAPDSALHEFQVIIERSPDHVQAWNGLALAYAHIGAFAEATKALEHAKTLEPDNPETQTNFGVVAAYQQRWNDARTIWKRTVERHPQFAPAVQNLDALNALSTDTK